MADVVNQATRSRMMSGIRGKNTKPELLIRRGLHARGFRFRLHCKDVPGNPDICFRSRKAAIFVHGCFWHMHECHLFKWPSTRPEFWRGKLERNAAVDSRARRLLLDRGWRVATVWECSIKGPAKRDFGEVIEVLGRWLLSDEMNLEITSTANRMGREGNG